MMEAWLILATIVVSTIIFIIKETDSDLQQQFKLLKSQDKPKYVQHVQPTLLLNKSRRRLPSTKAAFS